MNGGIFVSIEGTDGSGKSTQVALIKAFLDENGYKSLITREPGGTVISEKIRELLLDKSYSEMDGRTEALLYAAARARLVREVIRPALERGDIVICDRFVDSSIAYQGYGRNLGEQIKTINEFAVEGCMPDVTFLLKLHPEAGKSRIKIKNRDRLESERAEFYIKVYEGYEELERQYPDRIIGIDASKNAEDVHCEIKRHLFGLLGSPRLSPIGDARTDK